MATGCLVASGAREGYIRLHSDTVTSQEYNPQGNILTLSRLGYEISGCHVNPKKEESTSAGGQNSKGTFPRQPMFSKLLLVALAAVGANANLLTNKLQAKAVACDDPSGECGEGKDCHPKYVHL